MPEERELEKQLRLVSKTGKYVVGRREVMGSLKGSKLLVWSTSAGLPQSILDDSKNLQIPAIRFDGNPVELGRACGIPFRVSVIAVKSPGDADLKRFLSSSDYGVSSIAGLPISSSSAETEASTESDEESPKRKPAAEGTKRKARKRSGPAKEGGGEQKKKGGGEGEEEEEEEAAAGRAPKKPARSKAGEKAGEKSGKKASKQKEEESEDADAEAKKTKKVSPKTIEQKKSKEDVAEGEE
jgi:large subunit ribosomal protein L30e